MTKITIPAEVVNGHLHHERSLPEFEGQRVIATLNVVSDNPTNGPRENASSREPMADFDSEAPPWLEVERDLYFPMTTPSMSLGKVQVKVEEGKPCIILPEELPDD